MPLDAPVPPPPLTPIHSLPLQVWSYGFTTSPTGQPDLDHQLAALGGSNGSNGGWWQQQQQVLVPGVADAEREWLGDSPQLISQHSSTINTILSHQRRH